MRLTKKKAIEITKELWKYLAETGRWSKHNWGGWVKYGEMLSDCPCCEHRNRRPKHGLDNEDRCIGCPLFGHWGDYDECTTDDNKGFFDLWCNAESKEARKQAAQKIVDICDEALK